MRRVPETTYGLISIDPGLRATAWAAWNHQGVFESCGYSRNPREGGGLDAIVAVAEQVRRDLGASLDVHGASQYPFERFDLISEWPQIYQRDRSIGDPNTSLIPLAGIVGALASRARSAMLCRPAEWKGQTPKPKPGEAYIIETRVRARLEAEGLLQRAMLAVTRAAPPSLRHNVWDAIGIGLWGLGKFEPRRVFAR